MGVYHGWGEDEVGVASAGGNLAIEEVIFARHVTGMKQCGREVALGVVVERDGERVVYRLQE